MRKNISLIIIGLLIATLYQPIFFIGPAKAQTAQTTPPVPLGSLAASSSGTRYGMNAEFPRYDEMAYTDVAVESWWGQNPVLDANGYPHDLNGNEQMFFCIYGDTVGQQIYNFYGEGDFIIFNSVGGPFNGTVVPGSFQKIQNSDGVYIVTCQLSFNITPPSPGTFGVMPGTLNWMGVNKVNPSGDPKNWPKNFHLIRPGYPAWQSGNSFYPVTATSYPIFTKEYLKSFAPFCCIRFMDWMNTNGNTGLSFVNGSVANSGGFSWAQRPQLNYFGLNAATAYENMIALCNATNCDMWMNVPLQATDDWKVGFANLVANDPNYRLNSNLHVYYEHGNELWNWGFLAWQLVDQKAQADFGPTAAWFNHGQEMGKMLMSDVTVMQPIFNQVSSSFGRPIAAGQFGDVTSYCGGMLAYIQNNFGPPSKYIYGIAGAPYFSSDPTEFSNADLTRMQTMANFAKKNGVQMCAYEGGQGLGSTPEATFDTSFAFQESSAMATQYNLFAQMWQQNGGDLCNFFTNVGLWSQYGFWGHLPVGSYINNLSDPACIKYVAAAAIAASCNCGNAVPPPPPIGNDSKNNTGNNSGSGAGNGTGNSSNNDSSSGNGLSSGNGSTNNSIHPGNWSPGGVPKSE